MVTLPGAALESGLQLQYPIVEALTEHPTPVVALQLLDGQQLSVGSFTNTQPVTLDSRTVAGVMAQTFFDDFYNQLFFLPARLDFGTITAAESITLQIWNAYLGPTVLESIEPTGGQGLSVSGPIMPFTMASLASGIWTVTAAPSGPAELNAIIHFVFNRVSRDIVAVGTRAETVALLPNWRESFKVTYSFKTEILVSRSGREQRRALRWSPRKSFEFLWTARRDQLQQVNGVMSKAQNRTLLMVEETRFAETAVETAAGSLSITFAPRPRWLVAGTVIMLEYKDHRESVQVASVLADAVSFDSGTTRIWPAGTRAYPHLSGRLADRIATKRLTNATADVTVLFDVMPGSEPKIAADPATPWGVWNGREVLLAKPNWGEAVTLDFEHERDLIDYGRGVTQLFSPVAFGTPMYRATYTGKTQAEMDRLIQFFCRRRGKCGEFYMPTWENDLPVVAAAEIGSHSLEVSGAHHARLFDLDTVHRALVVINKNGTMQMNAVQRIFPLGEGQSLVSCADQWTAAIVPANVLMVCWLLVWRFASDEITAEYLTRTVGQISLPFQALEDLAA